MSLIQSQESAKDSMMSKPFFRDLAAKQTARLRAGHPEPERHRFIAKELPTTSGGYMVDEHGNVVTVAAHRAEMREKLNTPL